MRRKFARLVAISVLLFVCLGLPAVDHHYISLRGDYTALSSTIDGEDRAYTLSPAFLSSTGFARLGLYQSGDDRAFNIKSRILLPSKREKHSTRQIFKDGFLREERKNINHMSLKLFHYNQGNFARHTELEMMFGFRLEGEIFKDVSIYCDSSAGLYFFFTRMSHMSGKDINNFDFAYDFTLGMNVKNRLFANVSIVPETDFYVPYNLTWGLRSELLVKLTDSWQVGFEDNFILNDYYFNKLYATRHERTIFLIWRRSV